jgi:predicted dehydrogenase
MQTSAAAGAASVLLGQAAIAQTEPPPRERVRVGIVGVGNRGTALLAALLQIPYVDVLAVGDLVPDRAANAQATVEKARGNRPDVYTNGERDYERLVARDDLDAVVCATYWEWHTPVCVAAMRAGKYAASEVPVALTLEECHELVRVSEETGVPCMMLENVCYFREALTLLRMVRENVFGELLHAEAGYQHDCRFLMFTDSGELTWRGKHAENLNGNLYPTHPIGPIAQWFNINRGDRFTRITSRSTKSRGLNNYAANKFGPDHPLAKKTYALGDINTTLLETANGLTVVLYFDLCTPRPYDLILRLNGTKGMHIGSSRQICIEGMSPKADAFESFDPYLEKYAHPLWTGLEAEASKNGGHGGSDYITVYEFVKAVKNRGVPPQDVYDAAVWSAIVPLSVQSVAEGKTLDFPDFTSGQWSSRPPIPIYGA